MCVFVCVCVCGLLLLLLSCCCCCCGGGCCSRARATQTTTLLVGGRWKGEEGKLSHMTLLHCIEYANSVCLALGATSSSRLAATISWLHIIKKIFEIHFQERRRN